MLPAGHVFGQSLINPIFDSGSDAVAVFLQHHHITVVVNAFLAKIDPGGVASGLIQTTFPDGRSIQPSRRKIRDADNNTPA